MFQLIKAKSSLVHRTFREFGKTRSVVATGSNGKLKGVPRRHTADRFQHMFRPFTRSVEGESRNSVADPGRTSRDGDRDWSRDLYFFRVKGGTSR